MNPSKEEKDGKDDFAKGIAYFWRSTNLEPRIRSVALSTGISKVALGNSHTLLLTFDSQLLSVGDNSFGQLGLGDLKPRREPAVIHYFREKRVLEISCGGQHSGVVCASNEIFFWGDSSSGQCGIGDIKLVNQPTRVQFERFNTRDTRETNPSTQQDKDKKTSEPVIIQIACGDSHSLAVSTDGEVWSWGTGCQLGHGVEIDQVTVPTQIEFLIGKHVTSVACGAYHSLAVIQGDLSYPTFMLSKGDEDLTSLTGKPPKREKLRKKQRKLSKRSSPKHLITGKHESHRTLKVDMITCSSNIAKPSVTRTYLSYEPVVTEKRAGSTSGVVANTCTVLNLGQDQSKEKLLNNEQSKLKPLSSCGVHAGAVVSGQDEGEVASHLSIERSTNSNDASLIVCESTLQEARIDKSVNIDSEKTESFQTQSSTSIETTESNENSFSSNSPDEYLSDVSPFSPTSATSVTYFASTDSDSEDSLSKVCQDRKPKETVGAVVSKNSSGFYSAVGSRLIRPDVNLSKLTSAVVGSVTGMFTTSLLGQISHCDPPRAVMINTPCKQCGLLGLCLCDAAGSKFKLAGANTQVWSWGRGGCGQLGLGDTEDRFYPCCVKELSDVGVIKLAAGTFHSLAQTVCSQVFSWGDNSCGQLGRKKSMALQPKKIRVIMELEVHVVVRLLH